jgi:hypothetical protein
MLYTATFVDAAINILSSLSTSKRTQSKNSAKFDKRFFFPDPEIPWTKTTGFSLSLKTFSLVKEPFSVPH